MAVTWSIDLKCEHCGAAVHIENERPDWKVDALMLQEYENAKRWVEEHKDHDFSIFGSASIPRFVRLGSSEGGLLIPIAGKPHLEPLPELRYIDCPAGCGGKVYMGSGQA